MGSRSDLGDIISYLTAFGGWFKTTDALIALEWSSSLGFLEAHDLTKSRASFFILYLVKYKDDKKKSSSATRRTL